MDRSGYEIGGGSEKASEGPEAEAGAEWGAVFLMGFVSDVSDTSDRSDNLRTDANGCRRTSGGLRLRSGYCILTIPWCVLLS